MKPRILLINPWIYDFAAYNLWARPLGLYTVAEYLGSYDVELALLDCTGTCSDKKYGTGKYRTDQVTKPSLVKDIPRYYKRYGISPDEFRLRLQSAGKCNLICITSVMSYWYPGVQAAIEIIRSTCSPDLPIILGGIYPTLYPEHATQTSGADYIYRGSLNDGFKSLLDGFGIVKNGPARPVPYYRLGICAEKGFAPLRTSVGCPFHCSYCASNILEPEYKRAPVDAVVQEIRERYRAGIRDFAFYDDALLVDPEIHIKPILRKIRDEGLSPRFHAPNGLHARFIDDGLARLLKESGFRSLRLSLETVDEKRQNSTGGKVANDEFTRAIHYLKKNGFSKPEIGVYLMYGLPGQGLEEVLTGIRFLKGLNVNIFLAEFSPIKGTPMWGRLVHQGVIHDDLDPLLTNNTVFSYLYSGYDHGDVQKMKIDVKEYNRE